MTEDLSAIADFKTDAADANLQLQEMESLANSVARTLSSGFRSAIVEGRSFKSVLGDIALRLSDITIASALKPFENLTSGLVNSVLSAATTKAFAKGGVVASPTYFPLSQGLGLTGEAGPEAILPLTRGSDGRLGVAAGQSQPVSISVNVQATDAKSFASSEAELSAMLLRAVKRGTRAS